MKALILAAGFGTRLRPYTEHTPKPLFPIDGQPLIDRLISQLRSAGCKAIAVNTHYHHGRIEAHISKRDYGLPVFVRHEPQILGTGGAIRNLSDFWDDSPFLVVNADILTDIDFGEIVRFHGTTGSPATMVLVDDPLQNSVTIDDKSFVSGFLPKWQASHPEAYTFTGIQVIDPSVLSLIPHKIFYSSINAYRRLIEGGTPPAAFLARSGSWQDLGTPLRYSRTSREAMAVSGFRRAFGAASPGEIHWYRLSGDGSDRKWYRVQSGGQTLVAVDHGIREKPEISEVDAFVNIGRHLATRGVPVPEIHASEPFSGWVVMEDVGDLHLQTVVEDSSSSHAVESLYCSVLDILISFSQDGIREFDLAWAFQSTAYDRRLILERECLYFTKAFLKGYLGIRVDTNALMPAFNALSDGALEGAVTGLMHRDFQSRNIMIQSGSPRIIDFQGARSGPFQYDLASLLIDPYTDLPLPIQESLYAYAVAALSKKIDFDQTAFRKSYESCRITRNLQALGAFGYLTREKRKPGFEAYIPAALATLKRNLACIDLPGVSMLRKIVEETPPFSR